jgi:hypothetical protein
VRRLLATAFILTFACVVPVGAADKDKPKDTDKSAATRKALAATKISVDWKDTLAQDVVEELTKKLKEDGKAEVTFKVDTSVSGLNTNKKITYSSGGKAKPVTEILDEMCKKNELGYIVISGSYAGKKYPAAKYDGAVILTKGDERGYPSAK